MNPIGPYRDRYAAKKYEKFNMAQGYGDRRLTGGEA